jgi:hypothetical protein
LLAEAIPKAVRRTPDFKISRDAQLVAFCEVKSPQDIFTERVNRAITSGHAGVIETGYGNDYRQARCIERAARKAASQFAVANSTHSVPNILVVVNHDAHADVEDFVQTLTGTLQGRVVASGMQNTIPEIDLYAWLDQKDRRNEPYRAGYLQSPQPAQGNRAHTVAIVDWISLWLTVLNGRGSG